MTVEAGVLYVVATPIGHYDDISARALVILRSVNGILAEDTRHSGQMLTRFGIDTPMSSLHDHNELARVASISERLRLGDSLALISDAGTPLISDPGFKLVRALRELQFKVVPIPGACALIAALSAAGLPTDRFRFEGFLPPKSGARCERLKSLQTAQGTLIFYEAPHRIQETLEDAKAIFGAERQAVLTRELTKTFETFISGSLAQLCQRVAVDPDQQRGEIVLLIHGADEADLQNDSELERVLNILMAQLPTRQAVDFAGQITGRSHKQVYSLALQLKNAGKV